MQLPVSYFWPGWQSEHALYPLWLIGNVVIELWLILPGDHDGYVWQFSQSEPKYVLYEVCPDGASALWQLEHPVVKVCVKVHAGYVWQVSQVVV